MGPPEDPREREEHLTGGKVSAVSKVGDTVRRGTGPWTPAVHALLRHLERVGFDGAPRVLGTDEWGARFSPTSLGWCPTARVPRP